MIEQWKKQLKELSGNLTTNSPMPQQLIDKLLEEDITLKDKVVFEEINFPQLDGLLAEIRGLNILAGLQETVKKGYFTVFRAIRFPTIKRIHDLVCSRNFTVPNYEHTRILEFYQSAGYLKRRKEIQKDDHFWVQPQERMVSGLPVFCLINDALQLHHAFRGEKDQVVMTVVHIPQELIMNRQIIFIANAAIDLDFNNTERDVEIKDFVKKNGKLSIDYAALRARSIDLYEMYTKDLPREKAQAKALGIEQEFFLLHVNRIVHDWYIEELITRTDLLRENQFFLHGFFGDQSIFSRRRSEYLPYRCQRITSKQ